MVKKKYEMNDLEVIEIESQGKEQFEKDLFAKIKLKLAQLKSNSSTIVCKIGILEIIDHS